MNSNMRIIALLSVLFSFFSCSSEKSLPHLDLQSTDEFSWHEKLPFTLGYTDQSETENLPGVIKLRGGYSSGFYKHSFTFKLDEHRSLAGLPKDNDWILNAGYIDKTFMRHKISYDLFREMSSERIAPRCAYVNASENGVYQGLYILMERMDGTRLKMKKDDSLAMIFKDPPIFYKDSIKPQDADNYFHQKFPDKEKSDKSVYLQACRDFLFNASDSVFVDSIGYWFDIENVIDWHLIIRFSNNGDGVMKNFYLYKQNSDTPFRFAIWDYDHSFGRDGDNEMNMNERHDGIERNVLLRRLLETNARDYSKKLSDRYFSLRRSGLFSRPHFDEMIAKNLEIIEPHLTANFTLWPVNAEAYFDSSTFENEIEIMKQFMDLRLEFLDDYFTGLE